MSVSQVLVELGKFVDLIPKMIGANGKAREELINTVSDLTAALQVGLDMTGIHLRRARHFDELARAREYLAKAPLELSGMLSNFGVCKNLRLIHDRFKRLFAPINYSLAIGNRDAINALLVHLDPDEKISIEEF